MRLCGGPTQTGTPEVATRNPELHRVVPPCLLALHQKANGTELDGEGIQAWVEWEMEAMWWRVPIEISRGELEELVDRNPSTASKALKTISNAKERA